MIREVINTITGRPGRTAFRVFQVLFIMLAQVAAPLAGLLLAQSTFAFGQFCGSQINYRTTSTTTPIFRSDS